MLDHSAKPALPDLPMPSTSAVYQCRLPAPSSSTVYQYRLCLRTDVQDKPHLVILLADSSSSFLSPPSLLAHSQHLSYNIRDPAGQNQTPLRLARSEGFLAALPL